MKKRKKLDIRKLVLVLLMGIFAGLFIFSAFKIVSYLLDNEENRKIKNTTKEMVTIEDGEYKVDFKKLKEQNPDTIAYLKVNNTNIDYVVVRGTDNSYYLKHNFNKEYNISGWIFADYKNKFDGSDKNIVIYGHSTKDGSMFGTLPNALNEKWQTDSNNLVIKLVTEQGESKYQIFSTYEIVPEDYYITTNFNSDNEFSTFINKLLSRSNYDFGVEVTKDDSILTLSTCNISGSMRIVVHAKKIEDKKEELNMVE